MSRNPTPLQRTALALITSCLVTGCGGGEGAATDSTDTAALSSEAAPAKVILTSTSEATVLTASALSANAPAPSTPPVAAPSISIESTGAVCDGVFDNHQAIAAAISSAKSRGMRVSVPAGVCAYSDIIRLDGVALHGSGEQSVLHALNPLREAIYMSGEGPAVSHLKLSGVKASARHSAWEATRITVFGARNFLIDHVTIEGSAAAGIQTARSASGGVISNNIIRDTLSDSIHLTDKTSDVSVLNNRIENSGDDGIAVVSYRRDGGLVQRIVARNNTVTRNRWGRSMSVVGGRSVLYENNQLSHNLSAHACIYIAQEASYATHAAHDVVVRHNTLTACGGPQTGHGAIMVISDGQESHSNIAVVRNDIHQGHSGIRVFGGNSTGITLDSNRMLGIDSPLDIRLEGVLVTPYTGGAVGHIAH